MCPCWLVLQFVCGRVLWVLQQGGTAREAAKQKCSSELGGSLHRGARGRDNGMQKTMVNAVKGATTKNSGDEAGNNGEEGAAVVVKEEEESWQLLN